MRFLSLFAGIGGLDLGLERAGWECVGQVEIEPFAVAVLEKHWPNVRRWSDVREVTAADVLGSVGTVDAIVGGFPCQPWSVAGQQRGADDPRHLWPEYYRLVCGLRPRWIIGENVPGLLPRGADAVLADLETAGYTCWPIVLGADDCGAPHRRKRVFFVAKLANADCQLSRQGHPDTGSGDTGAAPFNVAQRVAVVSGVRGAGPQSVVADADSTGWGQQCGTVAVGAKQLAAQCGSSSWSLWPARPGEPQYSYEEPRTTQPEMGGATDGVPHGLAGWRTGALKGLGNAVVPQVAEAIGRAVLAVDKQVATCDD